MMIALIICCVYLFIGLIFFVLTSDMNEGYLNAIKEILFWPITALMFIMFAIYWLIFIMRD